LKILVIALSGIGDALLFTPSIIKMKEALPDAQIDMLVMYSGAEEIYKRIPQINQTYNFDFLNSSPIAAFFYIIKLRKKYDASINVYPSNRREYNLISTIIGAKKRVGVRYLRKDLINLGFLHNLTIKENDGLHNIETNIKLCEKLSGIKFTDIPQLQFPLKDQEIELAKSYLVEKNINENELVIGFHAGCSPLKNHTKRRWAPQNFSNLGKRLIEELNAKVLLFGGPEEADLLQNVFDGINSDKALIVKTSSLPDTAAVMKRCDLFVSNDSSLMHIASALMLKVIAIIGPTNTNYIKPWQTENKIVSLNLDCAPCFYYSPKPLTCYRKDVQFKCVKELPVEMVLSAVKKFLQN
jgi:heptosyltransferase-2